MKRYNGYELTEEKDGPFVKWDDVMAILADAPEQAARIAALEAALRPFADLIDYTDEGEPETRKARIPIEIRHIRTAHELLNEKG